jgi:N-acetylmuramoyl-L-alanine amidase
MLIGHAGWASADAKSEKSVPASVPKLYLNGKELSSDVPPELVNQSVLVPVRTITENLGYTVKYDQKAKRITINDGNLLINMTLNDPYATVNGERVKLVEPPTLRSDRALIPLRFVGETFGLEVYWDHPTKSVFLYSNDRENGKDEQPADPPADSDDSSSVTDGTENKPEEVAADPAKLLELRYQPNYLVITYEGQLSPVVNRVGSPERIVIDLPNTEYAETFTSGFSSGMASDYKAMHVGPPAPGIVPELLVIGHEALAKIRYSKFSDSPKSARIVLDLSQPWGYDVIHNETSGQLLVRLNDANAIAVPGKTGYTVILDAGHGGSDPGAQSLSGKWEKDFNLSMVKKIKEKLANTSDINLVLTREDDSYPTLDDRVNLANALQADLFVSIHGNSFKPEINGTETYYNREDSLAFAKLVHKKLVAATGFKDNGVRQAEFRVIKYTTMPAVLLEIGYLSNESNERAMFDEAFQNRVASAIAESIKQYFQLN